MLDMTVTAPINMDVAHPSPCWPSLARKGISSPATKTASGSNPRTLTITCAVCIPSLVEMNWRISSPLASGGGGEPVRTWAIARRANKTPAAAAMRVKGMGLLLIAGFEGKGPLKVAEWGSPHKDVGNPPMLPRFNSGEIPSDLQAEIRDDSQMDLAAALGDPSFRRRIAWTVCLVVWVLLAGGLIFALQTVFVTPFVGYPLAGGGAALIGALVVSRLSDNRSGWLLIALATAIGLNVSSFQLALFITEGDLGGLAESQGLVAAGLIGFYGITLILPLLLLTFPDGHLPSCRWRLLVGALVVLVIAGAGIALYATGGIFDIKAFLGSLEVGQADGVVMADWIAPFFAINDALILLIFLASAASLLIRLRNAGTEERQQIKWVVFTGLAALVLFPVDLVRSSSEVVWVVQQGAAAAGALALPIGFGVALLRYRLWDIDGLIRRSVIYGILWLLIALAYIAVAAGLGLVADRYLPVEVAIGLTVLTTLIFLPARQWLERSADRWIFGRTTGPVEAVQDLSEVLGRTDRPREIAIQLAHIASGAAALAWVEVSLDQSVPVTVGSRYNGDLTVISIRRAGESFGTLSCLPHPGRRLSKGDIELLEAMAFQAGLAVAHVRLASRIVSAQETERRRIERDIHDGAQQELATLVARLGLARAEINGDASAQRVLTEIQQEVRRILANLRELAQGIHPSVLRDGGIAALVRDRCSRLPIRVHLDVDPRLRKRRFADDIEGAAFFFISEALANVLKHSHSNDVRVRLVIDSGDLCLEVRDSGVGLDENVGLASGLAGLADRMEALGGELAIADGLDGGVTLAASLPVATDPAQPT
jgi:signal transduction histidine kinase